jgi:hypothetical protein
MKFIQQIYSVQYEVKTYREGDLGDTITLKEDYEEFHFSYEEAIDSYVSHCEDGNYASYEPVDIAISNSIKAYDEILGYYTENLVRAFLTEKPNTITDNISIQIETVKGLMEVLFQHTKVHLYDIEKRYLEYYKFYLEKHKINN